MFNQLNSKASPNRASQICLIYESMSGVSEHWFHSLKDALEFAIFWPENTYNLVIE